jgi:hypothetical protein
MMLALQPLTAKSLIELEDLLHQQFPTASPDMIQSAIAEILKKFHMRQCTMDHTQI